MLKICVKSVKCLKFRFCYVNSLNLRAKLETRPFVLHNVHGKLYTLFKDYIHLQRCIFT
jgi:hypothetical protein